MSGYSITEKSRQGVERKVFPVGDMPTGMHNAIGYLCALAPMDLSRRTVEHCIRQTKSFSCSSYGGGMLRLEWKT